MASLYLRGKTWWISYQLDGRGACESTKTRDRRKAERYQAAKETALERGEVQVEKKLAFDSFIELYEASYLSAGGRECAVSRERSWRKDSFALRCFFAFAPDHGAARLDKVTPPLVEEYRAMRSAQGKGLSDSTVNKDLRVLRAAWNWAKRMGYVKENPFSVVKMVRIAEHEVDVLSVAEALTLLGAVKGKSMETFVATALYAGLRLDELLSLEWSDVDFKTGWIQVINKPNFKTKSRRARRVPIAPELDAILRPAAQPEGRCFMTRPSKTRPSAPVSQNIGQRLTELGARLGFYVTPHVLRKTFGTILLARDVPIERISAWLGHGSISVTQKWYARHTLDAGRDHINALTLKPKKAAKARRA